MERATAPVVGLLILLGITVLTAGAVGVAVTTDTPEPPPAASLELTVDAETGELTVTHRGGDPLDLEKTEMQVEIDGEPLTEQPPIPFFAADGFHGGPTGPFNSASDDIWRTGESGTLTVADTNEPRLRSGVTVTVTIITDGSVVAELSTEA